MKDFAASHRSLILASVYLSCIGLIALLIAITGGLPSQYGHLYYFPVILAALTLPSRGGLAVAVLAALIVSPAFDLLNSVLGYEPYFTDHRPWQLTPDGWLIRPISYIAISVLASRVLIARTAVQSVSSENEDLGRELSVLATIDKMILAGATEDEAIREIARLVRYLTGAQVAGIVVAGASAQEDQTFYGLVRAEGGDRFAITRVPYGEGVTGWAMEHRRTTSSRNVLRDNRYRTMADVVRRGGYTSAAATPISLDGEIFGAVLIGYEDERDFPPSELETLERIANQAAIAIANSKQRRVLKNLAADTAVALAGVIESRDSYTGEHSSRVALYSEAICRTMGLPPSEIEVIKLGAGLHDVGKIVVPDEILKKPGKLTPDEFAVMAQHSTIGGEVCSKVPFLNAIYPIVYHHHERFDGKGYPDGLAGTDIPLGARVVAVADGYDAMSSDRVYRKALQQSRILEILHEEAGREWDAKVVEALLDSHILDLNPAGLKPQAA